MSKFSTTWKSSVKPRKQRKYLIESPLHIKSKFLGVSLSDELSKKHTKRSLRVRKGDKVKIMSGQFKGKTGKVEKVDTKNTKIYVEGIEYQKKEGGKIKYPVSPSNLKIIELDLNDKKRQEAIKRK